ncbi:hypothetical protein FACS18949_02590 [Clostridia bacterium]|nr:hypothetical protein FACS18949_02590 [Clostridia bacterium]
MYTRYARNGGFFEPEYESVSFVPQRVTREAERLEHLEPPKELVRQRRRHSKHKELSILDNLNLDTGDILLIALLLYLYNETGDQEMLLLLGVLFLL